MEGQQIRCESEADGDSPDEREWEALADLSATAMPAALILINQLERYCYGSVHRYTAISRGKIAAA